jgi:hypothetical protein
MKEKRIFRLFLIIFFLFFTASSSANLVGIDPGTIFAPSDSNTKYVLWDTSMHKLTINNWTIYLEDYIFNIESGDGEATIDINQWRVPDIDLGISANGILPYDLGGFVSQKHYRLYLNGIYHSIQANESGCIVGACFAVTDFSTTGQWDINLDGVVNYLEVSLVIGNYGRTGSRGWIPSDINDDGKINYLEISTIVSHYGQH